jgi:predicted  nucleic acid-binding Zn-ribbon protein
MTDLQEDERDLNGKIKKYRDDLEDNRHNQEDLQKEIDNKVKAIELLRGQRLNIEASQFQRVAPSMSFDKTPAVKIAYPYL